MSSSGIAWESDVKFKFRNSPEGSTGQFFPPFAYERQAGCDALSGAPVGVWVGVGVGAAGRLRRAERCASPSPSPTPNPNHS